MPHRPKFAEFVELAKRSSVVTVYRQLVSDTLTPVSAFCKLNRGSNAFLFESVVGGERVGRYSFVGADPFLHFEAFGKEMWLTGEPDPEEIGHPHSSEAKARRRYEAPGDPLDVLGELLARYRAGHVTGLPRFCGGAVGYMGYDVVRFTEHLPNAPVDDRHLPDLAFDFYDSMVIFDHIQKTIAVTAHARVPAGADPGGSSPEPALQAAYDAACHRVDELVRILEQVPVSLPLADIDTNGATGRTFRSNFSRGDFENAVERCKEYIRAGDIFQVVISQRLETETTADAFDIYRTLRVVNPSPFMFYLRTGPATLVGSSPEIMVRVEDDLVTIRPLAGTRRRGATPDEDSALAAELLGDAKERAEHIMLVDLGRNDVGRVARYETVQLSDVMTVERYSHVMHITSNVTGRLGPGKSALDALRACVPAGTVSGAPKVRAMQIIDEIEPHRRGPYAGAVGYIDFTGNMDTCIALRTLVLQGKKVYLQAGAGIVYDSVPGTEYEETLSKARGLLKAIEIAESQITLPNASTIHASSATG
jgi:anthranilate synthase component 1